MPRKPNSPTPFSRNGGNFVWGEADDATPLAAGGNFSPDFVANLDDGRVFVVEHKGAHLLLDPDEQEKIWSVAIGHRAARARAASRW